MIKHVFDFAFEPPKLHRMNASIVVL